MHLNDLNRPQTAVKALKENFDYKFDVSNLSKMQAKSMLDRVSRLIKEAKSSKNFHRSQHDSSYLKLVFMAQALSEHYNNKRSARIVVENAEVEKSQVILAAQDMVDSVQKMIEEVNDMLVKELPALVDSIQSDIGVNESSIFGEAAKEALTELNKTLSNSKQTLQNAMNEMTGQGGPEGGLPAGGDEMAVTDLGGVEGGEEGPEMPTDLELPGDEESPEMPKKKRPRPEPLGGVGRERR
jgi:hypothetical protein